MSHKNSLVCLAAVAILLSLTMAGEGQERRPAGIKAVLLRDVHPLYGGLNLSLHTDGTGACQIVSRHPGSAALSEQRFRLSVPHHEMQQILRAIEGHRFVGIQLKRKAGVPGESRATIAVTLTTGKTHIVSKWANEPNSDFEAIHAALRKAASARHGAPIFDGEYDARWVPAGFTLP